MTAPFVTSLRSRAGRIVLAPGDAPRIMIRVQIPEVWDAVRVDLPVATSVMDAKVAALATLAPEGWEDHENYVVKLHGFEVLDEQVSLTEEGIVDGSILLVTLRRRRAVRA